MFDFVAKNRAQIVTLTAEHVSLVGTAMLIAIIVGVPLGILITRWEWFRKPVLGSVNIIQTIPSLALFGFLLPLPWLGSRAERLAVAALAAYALLPIVRNTYTGILGIDPAVREAAIGMGLNPGQLLWRVELPLTAPFIFSGIRIATVTAIGVATIAAAVGAGGLGEFIFRGVAMVSNQLILAGAVPAAALALLADLVLWIIERRLRHPRAQ